MAMPFDASGLGKEWDDCESIRARLRSGKNLVVGVRNKGQDATISECTANSDVLIPVLQKLFVSQLKLPEITHLRQQVEEAYQKCQREVQADTVDDDAWDIRKMIRFCKRKANRAEPSLDAWLCPILFRIFELFC